jgi:hypothetical protein
MQPMDNDSTNEKAYGGNNEIKHGLILSFKCKTHPDG